MADDDGGILVRGGTLFRDGKTETIFEGKLSDDPGFQASIAAGGAAVFAPLPQPARNPLTGMFHADGMGVVGDGVTDDTAAIQAAINTAAGQGILYFPPGIYLLTGTISVPSNTHATLATGATFTFSISPAFQVVGNDVTFEGGKYVADTSARIAFALFNSVERTTLKDFSCANAVVVSRTTGGLAYADMVPALWARDLIVTNVRATSTHEAGTSTAIRLQYLRGAVVTNCIVTGYRHGISWWGGDSNPGADGVASAERRVQDIVIADCYIHDVFMGGIWGSMGQGVAVTGCVVLNCGDVGIDSEGGNDVTISGNRVAGCANGGITTFFLSRNTAITGNVVSALPGTPAIKIYNSSSGSYADNCGFVITGNTLACYDDTAVAALIIESATNVLIESNSLTNVRIATQTTGNFMGVSIQHNQLYFRGIMAAAFTALHVGHHRYVGYSVRGNRILAYSTQPAGSIAIDASSDDANASPQHEISDNEIKGFPTDLSITSSGTNAGQYPRFRIANNRFGNAAPVVTIVHGGSYSGLILMDGNRTTVLGPYPSAVPTSGRWLAGQQIMNPAPTAGGSIGWINTVAGWAESTAWAASTVYAAKDYRVNDSGKVYVCTVAGTSAPSGGPTGTTSAIVDGTVTWRYVGVQTVWKTFGAVAA